jgi:Skp family chaperone for outer membrane proteins
MNEKLTIAAFLVLLIWSSFLSFQLFGGSEADLPNGIRDGSTPVIAFVHGDSIQSNYAYILDREKDLFIALQQAQTAMERQSRPLQQEAQELIEYANGPSATQDEIMMAQNRLMEIENALNQMQNQQQTELMQLESSIQGDIALRLSEEVEAFADESGLDVVLNWGRSGEGVLYGAAAYDVTKGLTDFMNERYVPATDTLNTEIEK